jgi:hypothetical protein
MKIICRFFVIALVALAPLGLCAQTEGEPLLAFGEENAAARWVAQPSEYETDPYYARVENPVAPKFEARVETLPPDARRYAGQSVLRISGKLNSRCDTLVFRSPFAEPSKGAKADSGEARGHPAQGFFLRAGMIEFVALAIKSDGAPVEVSLELVNDRGGEYYVSFAIKPSPLGWRTITSYDPQFSYIADRRDRERIEFGWLRLASITLSSIGMGERKSATMALQDDMTDARKREYLETRPAPPYEEEAVDITIRSVSVKQALD